MKKFFLILFLISSINCFGQYTNQLDTCKTISIQHYIDNGGMHVENSGKHFRNSLYYGMGACASTLFGGLVIGVQSKNEKEVVPTATFFGCVTLALTCWSIYEFHKGTQELQVGGNYIRFSF